MSLRFEGMPDPQQGMSSFISKMIASIATIR